MGCRDSRFTGSAQLFWHRVDTEAGYDGGVLEYSVDGGAGWHDMLAGDGGVIADNPGRFVQGGYTRTLSGRQNPLEGRSAWSGESSVWTQVEVDLADMAGRAVRLRWRLGCDTSLSGDGWWLDDVRLEYAADCTTSYELFADGFETGDTSRW